MPDIGSVSVGLAFIRYLAKFVDPSLLTMKDLANATDVALSSASRDLDALGEVHRKAKPGLGLVAKDWDPREPRRIIAWLTPKGQEVLSALLKVFSG